MDADKVVARYLNGRILKGYTTDFQPNHACFRVVPAAAESGDALEVSLKDLKAVFFVRTFAGEPQYRERKQFSAGESPPGAKVEVTFADSEILVGHTLVRDAWERPGFFLTPVDPRSNNQRVFVVTGALGNVRYF